MELEQYSKELYEKIHPVLEEFIKEQKEKEIPFDGDMFLHVLANVIPTHIHNSIEEETKKDLLDFNHLANKLIFKYH
jgi:hypothetical protein